MTKRKLFVLVCFLMIGLAAIGQTGVIRGNIYEKESGTPIIYCNVALQGTSYGGTTDIDGFFIIPNVPVGEYKIVATYVGYDSI
ncbi:MAG: carboxypeptidase-like regulatory domain-containing protein, partial [Saprospiraceae bacterium]